MEELGLTKGEIRVYLSLLSLGQTTTGPIITESKISSSKVYEILEKLMQKGLASFIIKNKTKYFQATSPSKLMDYLLTQEKKIGVQKQELNQHLPQLLAKYREHKIPQNAEIFLGGPAMKAMLLEIVADGKKGEEYLFFGGTGRFWADVLKKVYIPFAKVRQQKSLKVRGIGLEKYRSLMKPTPYTELRYISFPAPANVAIFKDKTAIISWTESPVGVLITSQGIANQFREFFESVWKVAKE